MKQKRAGKTTQNQFYIMVDFISQHKEMLYAKLCPSYTARKRRDLWEELASILNEERVGPRKTSQKWRKAWSDFKAEVKNKIRQRAVATEKGSPVEQLSPLYEKAANLLSKVMAEDERTVEVTVMKSELQSPTSTMDEESDMALNSDLDPPMDSERHFKIHLEYVDTDLDMQEHAHAADLPLPSTSSSGTKKKAHFKEADQKDLNDIVDAELKKAEALNKISLAMEERNLIEAEKSQCFKEANQNFKMFLDLFAKSVNK